MAPQRNLYACALLWSLYTRTHTVHSVHVIYGSRVRANDRRSKALTNAVAPMLLRQCFFRAIYVQFVQCAIEICC